ncbi:hypothetical protein K435DRAFT_847629 [Dendrothele bispora CBS 962.96]|uniref:Uncharacterized protein n=1 Tax=Dendrothele bispora (strain CBS 962.96) TaxID=1314807 RepID=A0A4S8MXI6_DENBC|nr:hypothetical protein K435DRAFT_847629 [Dendrothele bispora CBS 962.96]
MSTPEIILTKNVPETLVCLTAEDGVVGALHDSTFITCLKNTSSLPSPPSNQPIRVREDGRVGEHDYTLWPQYYCDEAPHLAVIPLRPRSDSKDHPYKDHLCMWDNILEKDIDWEGNSALSGAGVLKQPVFTFFENAVTFMQDEAKIHLASQISSAFASFIRLRIARLLAFRDRLKQSRKDMLSIRITVAGLQRIWLELAAGLRYMQVYQPVMNGNTADESVLDTVKVMGTFTDRLDVVEMFRRARVPVFFIRPISDFTRQIVLRQVPVHFPPTSQPASSTLADIFVGSPDDTARFHAISQFYARFLSYIYGGYNYGTRTSPSSSSPSSTRSAGPARQQSTQHVLRQRQKHGAHPGVSKVQKHSKPSKDSFRELSGVDLPPAISAWANANETVDVHSDRFLSERPDHHTYAFPPPSLFLKANPARQNAYFSQYDHLHDALIFRVESAFAGNTDLRPQEWRDILSLSFVDDANGEAKGFVDARRLLGECFERWGVALELVPTQPVSLTALQRKELLWNLCELNFRNELWRLDARLYYSPSSTEADDTERLILQHSRLLTSIFPENSLTQVSREHGCHGLSSSDWSTRAERLRCFRDMMSSWSVALPDMLKGEVPSMSSGVCEEWEKGLVRHYVQTFFDVFGRAAILPRTCYF